MARLPGLVVLVAFAAVIAPRDARAECGAPGYQLSPAEGAVLPPDPTVLVLAPPARAGADVDLEVLVDGAPGAFSTRAVPSGWLVDVRAPHGAEVTVQLRDPVAMDRSRLYRIDRAWRAEPTRVLGTARAQDHWSCSFTDILRVALATNAIGFEIAWGGDEPGRSWIPSLDSRFALFVDGDDGPEPLTGPGRAEIQIGHHSCADWNVSRVLYGAGGVVTLTAHHADGSREHLGALSLHAEQDVPYDLDLHDISEPPATPAAPSFSATVLLALVATFGALLGSLLGLVAARRRPRTMLFAGSALGAAGLVLACTRSFEVALLLAAGAGAISAALVWRLVRHPR